MILRLALYNFLSVLCFLPTLAGELNTAHLYAENCAECHGAERLGGTGPALIPETLKRMRGPSVEAVISDGRTATQMPAFGEHLSDHDIAELAAFIKTPLAEMPRWTPLDIASSKIEAEGYRPADRPMFTADPLNLFLVVESGDHHVSVLDGDNFEILKRFATPFAVHGGPKFTSDGRFVFIMSRRMGTEIRPLVFGGGGARACRHQLAQYSNLQG